MSNIFKFTKLFVVFIAFAIVLAPIFFIAAGYQVQGDCIAYCLIIGVAMFAVSFILSYDNF